MVESVSFTGLELQIVQVLTQTIFTFLKLLIHTYMYIY